MARPASVDPLDKFRWVVAIRLDGQETFQRLGFTSVEVPQSDIATKSYAEGGSHLFPKQIIDSVSYKPITLRRGVTENTDFHKWATKYIELVRGIREDGETTPDFSQLSDSLIANPFENERAVQPSEYRRDVSIGHLDREGNLVKIYRLYKCIPISYKPASDFDSAADDEMSIESITLSYESFNVESLEDRATNPLDPTDVFKRLTRRAF